MSDLKNGVIPRLGGEQQRVLLEADLESAASFFCALLLMGDSPVSCLHTSIPISLVLASD